MIHDTIVVGSGPAGANAAAALIAAGRTVLLLDVGDVEERYAPLIPTGSFSAVRASDPEQHRYFLGDDFEGVPVGEIGTGAQLTPPRLYVTQSTRRHLPWDSETFQLAESLALGGLGNAWGAGIFAFDDEELAEWPLTRDNLLPHYETVARRIGVSSALDDLVPFFGTLASALPPLELDSAADVVMRRYEAKRAAFQRRGFFLGRPPLAVCTTRVGDRGPHEYLDMDFWADSARSVYRPRWTVEELRARENFTYAGRRLVLRFDERDGEVRVSARNVDTGDVEQFSARSLVLAAGTLSTARIVLRSLERFGERVPLLCNPYTYVPVLNWGMLGREARDRRHSLAQLSAVYRPPRAHGGATHAVQTQYFSYRSLLTFKLLRESPLAHRETLQILQLLIPALGILGVSHDDTRSSLRYCTLERAEGTDEGRLSLQYALSDDESERIDSDERSLLRLFRELRCWPIKRVHPGHGASIHYAGTFPMVADPTGLTTGVDGKLAGTRAVHLVDGSSFPYLPAKGLTFTIMANADRIGSLLARRLA